MEKPGMVGPARYRTIARASAQAWGNGWRNLHLTGWLVGSLAVGLCRDHPRVRPCTQQARLGWIGVSLSLYCCWTRQPTRAVLIGML